MNVLYWGKLFFLYQLVLCKWLNTPPQLYGDLFSSLWLYLSYDCVCRMWEPCPTQLRAKVHNSSHQFGYYQKSDDPLLDSTADSSDNRESLLHHVTPAGSRETVVADGGTNSGSNTSLDGCTSGKFSLNLQANFLFLLPSFISVMSFPVPCLPVMHRTFPEVWDQNFVDEDRREKTGVSWAKLLKTTAMYDASTNDTYIWA
ncbi:uncharacterized protein LOC120123939 [Hibiscus syriacus]|uniref:uncharacterized protein LOC120123939 n=1 Tax=Hibiscus syriacus TaxID=106335 RepID=UPI001922ECB3|nr:uncharacterized protein LOC120123939 [Hibiscus syriacus]XP_038998649.1 uncharacterized protein LOC120123939 [Hibiscus syriacus]